MSQPGRTTRTGVAEPPGGPLTARASGAAAGCAVLAGALIMLVTLVAAPGPWLRGYVSEAGTAGLPFATGYRFGLVLLALGVALLGLAVRRWSVPAGVLLGSAAAFAATSGLVPCTNRCPLPPFEPTTAGDVAHTAASIAGLLVLTGAMVVIARSPVFRTAARRLAVAALALVVPLGGALGLTMLFVGRGPVGAVLERVLLAVAASWLIGTALLTVLRSSVKVEPWTRPLSSASRSSNADSPS